MNVLSGKGGSTYLHIYMDIVLAINLFINVFILVLTAWLLNIPWKKSRLCLSLFCSSIYVYVTVMYTALPLLHPFSKLLMSAILLVIAFGKRPLAQFILLLIAFYSVSFFVGGAILGYYFFVHNNMALPGLAQTRFDFSASDVAIGAFVASGVVYLFAKQLIRKKQQGNYLYDVIIEYGEKKVCLRALFDSGNHLYEMAGSRPVVLVERQSLSPLFSAEVNKFLEETDSKEWLECWQNCLDETWQSSFVLIAYRSVGADDFLIGQRVKKIRVKQAEKWHEFECAVGIYDSFLSPDHSYQALLHAGMDLGSID